MIKRLAAAALLVAACSAAAETVPFDSPRWKIEAKEHRLEEYHGKQALFLKDGQALLGGARLQDGVVEFDTAFHLGQGFSGVWFRVQDAENYELYYLRQALSGKSDASQYTPVIHNLWGWQIYTGPRYCAPLVYPDGEWFHVKLSFSGSRGEIEVGREVVAIPELKRAVMEGGLGLFAATEGARFANFEYRAGPVAFHGKEAEPEKQPPGVVTSWAVSTPFAETSLAGQVDLPPSLLSTLTWTTLPVEGNGIANFARLGGVAKDRETVMARTTIHADAAAVREIRFGYSDRVKVYLNGRLLYSGNAGFASRDPSFLGSVGLFDALALPLREGDNELAFAVSETFGGWGVMVDAGAPPSSARWKIEAKEHRFEEYRGKQALFLKDGRAILDGATLQDGVVEFDVAFRLARGFSGVMFRMADADNYEEFYLRQHLSGMPDANQYSPVFHKLSGWQIYTGPRYCTPLPYPDGEWFHVKLSLSGTRGEIEIDGHVVPIPELKRGTAGGGLGVYANIEGARFANFEFRPGPVTLRGADAAPETMPSGVITAWEVSTPFAETSLEGQGRLPSMPLQWTKLAVERNGVANLARLAGVGPGRETALARTTLHADAATSREVTFGFSDRVRVYLNGRLLYAGNDGYTTRDYRFLGSVGLWDTLALPLQRGDNELAFAVSENFGGWAVMATQ
jgi:hypothetical protein